MIKIAIAFGVLITASLLMKKKDMSYRQSILKTIYPMIMWSSQSSAKKSILENSQHQLPSVSIYTIKTKSIEGAEVDLAGYKGKKILIVNTASDCGFTGQYEALQNLQNKFPNDLVVVGFPANDFKEQEKLDNKAIATFCKKNYNVSFPLMEKSVVLKKNKQNDIYKWLTDRTLNGWCNQEPAWNFCKYLIDENGNLTHYFPMTVDPMDPTIIASIEQK